MAVPKISSMHTPEGAFRTLKTISSAGVNEGVIELLKHAALTQTSPSGGAYSEFVNRLKTLIININSQNYNDYTKSDLESLTKNLENLISKAIATKNPIVLTELAKNGNIQSLAPKLLDSLPVQFCLMAATHRCQVRAMQLIGKATASLRAMRDNFNLKVAKMRNQNDFKLNSPPILQQSKPNPPQGSATLSHGGSKTSSLWSKLFSKKTEIPNEFWG